MSGADPPLLEAPMSDGQALMSEGEAPMDEGAAPMDEGAAPSYTPLTLEYLTLLMGRAPLATRYSENTNIYFTHNFLKSQ